ncbi:hypothetical protein FORMB_13840 [Formosa sp. Hel1_33_131]|nr:hypothetical protein FORMB_13840 [Formosa sp. Hel1_33_131]
MKLKSFKGLRTTSPQNYIMKVERNHQDSLLNYWFSDKYNIKEICIEIIQECD